MVCNTTNIHKIFNKFGLYILIKSIFSSCRCTFLLKKESSYESSYFYNIIFKHALKPTNFDVRLFINGNRLVPSNFIKYLGILLDSDLSWKSQINNVAIKLKKANRALALLCHYVPPNVLCQVYYVIFPSHLQYYSQVYCSQVWGQPLNSVRNCVVSTKVCY